MSLAFDRGLTDRFRRDRSLQPAFPSRGDLPRKRRHKRTLRDTAVRPFFEVLEDLLLLSTGVSTPLSVAGSISGSVFNDLNGNGTQNQAEPGQGGQTVYLDLNHDGKLDGVTTTIDGTSTTIGPTPGELGSSFGGVGPTLTASGLPSTLLHLVVNLDLANNGDSPVTVAIASPTGLGVPDLPTLFSIQPGEHFVGTFDPSSTNPVTLAPRPLAPGTYQPQQLFTLPAAHIYQGSPDGQWALVFFGDTSGLVLKSWSLDFTTPEPSTQTDSSGNYSFTGVAPGSYQVSTALAPGEVATSPTGSVGTQTVQVVPGQNVSGVNFGVQPAADLAGTAFIVQSPATGWGHTVTINYTLTNQGMGDAGPFNVAVVLSSNGVFSTSGPIVGMIPFNNGLASQSSTSGTMTLTLPASAPAGFGSVASTDIGFVIDPTHAVPHNNTADSSNRGPGLDFAQLATQPNQAVNPSSSTEQDPSIAVDPTNSKHIVVAYMDYGLSVLQNGYAGIGVSVSENGGATWKTSSVPLPALYGGGAADPTVKFDADGNVYISYMAATFLGPNLPGLTNPDSDERQYGFQSNNGIFVAKSTDGGLTWGQSTVVSANVYSPSGTPAAGLNPVYFDITPDLAIDTNKTLPNGLPNPYYGDLYVTWVRLYPSGQFPGRADSSGGSDIMFAVWSNATQTWTTETQTDPATGVLRSAILDPEKGDDPTAAPGHGFEFYPEVTVGPEGAVYVSAFSAGDFAVFESSNGGQSFRAPDRANQIGVPFLGLSTFPSLPYDNFRTNAVRDIIADPTHPGRVYVAESNEVNDATLGGVIDTGEIIFAVSNDYGQSWNTVFQVGAESTNFASLTPGESDTFTSVLNDDDGGNDLANATLAQLNEEVTTGQALPSMAIDAQGNLNVTWYDTRRDFSQVSIDVFGTVSTDGGAHFSPNFRVTDATFDPNNGAFLDANGNPNYYLGDHIATAAANGVGYAVWTDVRTGTQQIEFQSYSLTAPPAPPVDRFSPNFTASTATDLGAVSINEIIPKLAVGPESAEWFQFQSAATGELIVSASLIAPGSGVALELTDLNGNVLPASLANVTDASGNVIGQQLVYPSIAGQSYRLRVTADGPNGIQYQLTVGSLTGDLGTKVQGGTTGSVTAGGESLYRLQAPVAGSLAVTLQSGADVVDGLSLSILGADGQTVLASGSSTNGPEQLFIPVTQGQVVVIAVSGVDGNAGGSFSLSFQNRDQYETPGNSSLFFPTGDDPTAIAAADLTGNGITDIVVSSTNDSDSLSVLMGNGDGTFQAPRQFNVGPGLSGALTGGYREIGITNANSDGVPDLIVPNFRGGNISVLIGNGDGTFQNQRNFDAVNSPDSLATGDFTGNGISDIATLQNFPQFGGVSMLAVMIGRGDGTYKPAKLFPTVFSNGAFPVRVGDFTNDGKLDLLVFSKNTPEGEIFIGNGDGTFQPGRVFATGENVFNAQPVMLPGSENLSLVVTGTNTGNVYLLAGNGDGTFQTPVPIVAMAPHPGDNVGVYGLAIADFGSAPAAGSTAAGAADGIPDIIVSAASRSGAGQAEIIMLPGETNAAGVFTGFGAPVVLATVASAGMLATGDFAHTGRTDIAVAEPGGVLVIYGNAMTVTPNTTPKTARDLGSNTHLVSQPQAIVSGHEDAYFHYTVPTESAAGSGPEVIDFSGLFQDVTGAGLQMQVLDPSGTVLGSGSRFRVIADQGEVLTIRVFGQRDAAGNRGTGVYTLDVDVLPQIVSVQAQSPLPGTAATSIVLTLQGDRLDLAAATDPSNYTVTWLGPHGPVVIPVAAFGNAPSVIYDPSAATHVASGLDYPTAVRQTITLLFTQPLPAGNYTIELSPNIHAAAYNAGESSLLADDGSFGGHPVVSAAGGAVSNGSQFVATDLVAPSGTPGKSITISQGTPFLTQLVGDLNSYLQQLVAAGGSASSITSLMNALILAELEPLLAAGKNGVPSITVIWFDPVSIDLETSGGSASYSLSTNAVSNGLSGTFVGVGGNVELLVSANATGTFNLDVSDVPGSATGGAVAFGASGASLSSFTEGLQSGATSFQITAESSSTGTGSTSNDGGGGGGSGSPSGPDGNAVASASSSATPTGAASLSLLATLLISGPETSSTSEVASSSSSSGAAAAGASGGGGASNGSETSRARPRSETSEAERALAETMDSLRKLGDAVQPYLKSSIQLLEELSGVLKALGVKPKFPVTVPWRSLLNLMNRPQTKVQHERPAAPVNPIRPAADAGADHGLPDDGPGVVQDLLWDLEIDGLLAERQLAPLPDENPEPTGAEAYLAASVLAVAAYQANLRLARRGPSIRPTSTRSRSFPDAL
jgi:hypothetical protein